MENIPHVLKKSVSQLQKARKRAEFRAKRMSELEQGKFPKEMTAATFARDFTSWRFVNGFLSEAGYAKAWASHPLWSAMLKEGK